MQEGKYNCKTCIAYNAYRYTVVPAHGEGQHVRAEVVANAGAFALNGIHVTRY